MKLEYNKGLVKVLREDMPSRCDSCNREVRQPFSISRGDKVLGEYGPKCVIPASDGIIKANEASKFGFIHQRMDFTDYFVKPKVKDVRMFQRAEPTGTRRSHAIRAARKLRNGYYLDIPNETEVKPSFVKNWRKKGEYIEVIPPTKEEIEKRHLTPKQVARGYIGKDSRAHCGLIYRSKTDNRNRIHTYVPSVEGRKIAFLAKKGVKRIVLEEDYGTTKVLVVPSTTKENDYHTVILENLVVEGMKQSDAFDFDCVSLSGDAIHSNLPKSWIRGKERRYHGRAPVRPDKFVYAALEFLMNRENNDILVDPRPFVPSNYGCMLEHRLSTRAVHQSRLLHGDEMEVLLWMSASPREAGYDKMFK